MYELTFVTDLLTSSHAFIFAVGAKVKITNNNGVTLLLLVITG